jgi:hypothetical protein
VRPVKDGKPGSVRGDEVEYVLELTLDPDIELRVTRLQHARSGGRHPKTASARTNFQGSGK